MRLWSSVAAGSWTGRERDDRDQVGRQVANYLIGRLASLPWHSLHCYATGASTCVTVDFGPS